MSYPMPTRISNPCLTASICTCDTQRDLCASCAGFEAPVAKGTDSASLLDVRDACDCDGCVTYIDALINWSRCQ